MDYPVAPVGRRQAASDFRQPAAFQLAWIGDQLLGLPAMRALAAMFPAGVQLLLGEGMLSFYYRGLPIGEPVRVWWDDYESGRLDRIDAASRRCDVFLSLSRHPSPFVAALARRLGAACTIGFGPIFDVPIAIDPDRHVVDQLFAVPQALDASLRVEQFGAPPVCSAAAETAAARYVARLRESADRILFVHPETRPHKSWPADRFALVLSQFLAQRPEYIAVVSSLAPVPYADEARCRRVDFHLELAMAVVGHANLFLGVDSCFLHAADLFRIPGVALFGPTSPREWGFRLTSPSRHVCAPAMDALDPGAVLDALLALAA